MNENPLGTWMFNGVTFGCCWAIDEHLKSRSDYNPSVIIKSEVQSKFSFLVLRHKSKIEIVLPGRCRLLAGKYSKAEASPRC
jgi:hypothetical protein